MEDIYAKYKEQDGVLYFTFQQESMVVKNQEEAKKEFAEGFKDLFVNMFKNEFRKDIEKKQDEQIEMKLFDIGVKAG